MSSLKFNSVAAWFETATAMNAAAATVGLRTVQMQRDFFAGRGVSTPETARMVSEKAAAMTDGAFAAARIWTRFWLDAAARGKPPTVEALAELSPAAAMAGARPGFQKARANARRLSRRQ